MSKFLELEGGYLVIALIILLVTAFVSTRPFMSKGAFKKGMLWTSLVLVFFIGLHFKITTDRMKSVKEAFANNHTVICESRATRKVAQSVDIDKSREWSLEGDLFVSPNYSRPFHAARCIVK